MTYGRDTKGRVGDVPATPEGTGRRTVTLRDRYAWYRRRQASMLLSVIPREGLRPLYRRARDWAFERGIHESKDPIASLSRYVEEILPLPPFDVWRRDFESNPTSYLEDGLEPPSSIQRREPVQVETRSVVHDGRHWSVELLLFNDGEVWRGFMVFRSGRGTAFRTADVFCEDHPSEIRERFLSFQPDTLRAFLRSALP